MSEANVNVINGPQGWFKREIKPTDLVTWALILFAVVGAYFRLDGRQDAMARDIVEIKAERVLSMADLKAKSASLDAEIKVIRDQQGLRQEAIIGRLARIETILERVEKGGGRL